MTIQKINIRPGSKIYLMGICGTGMAALAGLLHENGYKVVGSDSGCYPPMDKIINGLQIPLHLGYSPQNIEQEAPDLVIIGNVIRKENPEAKFVLNSEIPYMSFPQALGEFFLSTKKPLVVTGTHGKTTTSTLLVSALKGLGLEPGFLIGGVPIDEKQGFKSGKNCDWFVVEGDEYDTSFFQKVSKFLFYKPYGAIITSIEFDHADIFSDLEEIKRSFKKFVDIIPADGVIAACSDWDSVKEVIKDVKGRVITYGFNKEADWQPKNIKVGSDNTQFIAQGKDGKKIKLCIKLPGRHNVLNVLSVIALSSGLGLDLEKVAKGLEKCKGVKRRQEVKGEIKGITIIDDFAHHPRAVDETLRALREKYQKRRLIAIFEPRTNTSRRAIFQDYYSEVFGKADLVLVREVPEAEKFPKDNRFSSKKLVADLNEKGIKAHYFPSAKEIVEFVKKEAKEGDVYAVFSNGPFENIHKRLIEAIKSQNDI